MRLLGVDFWQGHLHEMTLVDINERCGPFAITIDEKVRQGSIYKVTTKDDSKISQFLSKHQFAGFGVVIDVMGKDRQLYYRISIPSMVRECGYSSLKFQILFQAKEVYENYDRKLQAVFGKDMYHIDFTRQLSNLAKRSV